MQLSLRLSLLALPLIHMAAAHQNMHQIWVNGVTPGYEKCIRRAPSNSPVTDVTSAALTCNVNGNAVPFTDVDVCAAAAGDEIVVQWDISSHPSPITHFLFGPVSDAKTATGVGQWFKIAETDYENGKWPNEVMAANEGKHSFRLPAKLQSGDYILRSEMLALHGSQSLGGAQFYIACAQLKISGAATASCAPKISLPGAYKAADANIYIPNFYNGFQPANYTAPGGPVATCT
ncbi:glycoside hydrolase [Tricharina praecox]|uniref:glycoside hydrolase n=1 Tax=Tricharina praecox TaxID=43433 RepID=UPI00221F06FE|nr:glycoside hydrolase [Tricharina praecox]KAI5844917.1 glycoside hydrolase [Tricharina praecox]